MKKSFDIIETYLTKEFELVDNGERSCIEFMLYLKQLEKDIKAMAAKVKEQATDAALNYGPGKHKSGEFMFSTRNAPGRWDFKHIKDWARLKSAIKALENRYKSAYKMYENDLAAVDTENGEVVELPIYNPGGESLILEGKFE